MARTAKRPGALAGATGPRVTFSFRRLDTWTLTHPPARIQYLAERLHRLGARALHEYVVELATVFGPEVVHRLEAYGRIDPAINRAIGGDRFPPPFFVLRGGGR